MANRKNKDRALAIKIFGHHYHRVGDDWSKCFYCGDIQQHLDHVPALALVFEYGAKALKDRGYPFLLVPSCSECNMALGEKQYFSLYDRLDFLIRFYKNKLLGKSGWNQFEVDEMGDGLRPYIQHRHNKLENWVQKLNHCERMFRIANED